MSSSTLMASLYLQAQLQIRSQSTFYCRQTSLASYTATLAEFQTPAAERVPLTQHLLDHLSFVRYQFFTHLH